MKYKLNFLQRNNKEHNMSILLLLVLISSIFFQCSNKQERTNTYKKVESNGQRLDSYITTDIDCHCFPICSDEATPLIINANDYHGIERVAKIFQDDIQKVTGKLPELYIDNLPEAKEIIIIGSINKNPLIKSLINNGTLHINDIEGKWETYIIEVIENPLPEVDRALVIAGSDKRGTIFGMFDVSAEMGVSPWYYWADVPVKTKNKVFVKPGRHSKGEPKVKYRGIFINDEAPALTGWVHDNFGGFNHEFYDHVYELILRLHGNFLWPAMWGRSIYDDDSLSAPLADEYGVVLGTSHHEPLSRAHIEWSRYGKGPWNYEKNSEELQKFWRKGIERMGNNESLVTVGMRGDGDEAMTEGTAIELLSRIVEDQRKIIEEVTGKPAEKTPQVWALYKEVQDYYDKGMRVPEDITLLLCDDNWGNVRILPKPEDRDRKGGFGIYYHYDFVGGPVSYRWLNVTQIERVWEQMNLSYQYGARKLWVVNVGDIKPMEFPISFFMDFAWNPECFQAKQLPSYYTNWAVQQFGEKYAKDIGDLIQLYTKYNSRRNPEMLQPFTYSLTDYYEAERIVNCYNELAKKAKKIYNSIEEEYKDAYYQLVLFPIEACANLNEMYVATGKNWLYSKQGRASANKYADKVRDLFNKDKELTEIYHKELANGKWNHMMSQTHIGYTSWDNPPKNIMPEVEKIKLKSNPEIGVAVEGLSIGFPSDTAEAVLPEFDPVNNQTYYIEIFNKSKKPVPYEVITNNEWIILSSDKGTVDLEDKILINVDWDKVNKNDKTGSIVVKGGNIEVEVIVPVIINVPVAKGFIENNGVISIEAAHYTNAISSKKVNWQVVPNLGKTGSGVISHPVNIEKQEIDDNSARLEYVFTVYEPNEATIIMYLSPTLNFLKSEGLVYGVSIDDEEPKMVNMHEGDTIADWKYPNWWNTAVGDRIMKEKSTHTINEAGVHTLKIWMVDPGIVFQKIVIDLGGLKPSYLGPPESLFIKEK